MTSLRGAEATACVHAEPGTAQTQADRRAHAVRAGAHTAPFIEETRFYRTLHFSPNQAQSRMLKREPDRLVLDYTRTMMSFLLFEPAPRHIAMIGLGGGSLAKFCFRELPAARIDVVEINPHVIALRDPFAVPPDGERFRVHLDDGARFVRRAPARFDVLLVDAYTRDGIPAQMASSDFYQHCRDVLCGNGIMVINLYCKHAEQHLRRIRASFGTAVIAVDEADGTNRVVFACRDVECLRSIIARRPAHIRPSAWSSLQPAFLRVRSAIRCWQAQCSATSARD